MKVVSHDLATGTTHEGEAGVTFTIFLSVEELKRAPTYSEVEEVVNAAMKEEISRFKQALGAIIAGYTA